ncbi:hypothetical protein DFH06DRAFT_1133737 [Mycena polygramma]|nr:hypothetical protein DFH06DRAFT_1133737 [Mycena polygramma]
MSAEVPGINTGSHDFLVVEYYTCYAEMVHGMTRSFGEFLCLLLGCPHTLLVILRRCIRSIIKADRRNLAQILLGWNSEVVVAGAALVLASKNHTHCHTMGREGIEPSLGTYSSIATCGGSSEVGGNTSTNSEGEFLLLARREQKMYASLSKFDKKAGPKRYIVRLAYGSRGSRTPAEQMRFEGKIWNWAVKQVEKVYTDKISPAVRRLKFTALQHGISSWRPPT